jgi:CheY-like chemotaxis protein
MSEALERQRQWPRAVRILIVDDDPGDVLMIEEALTLGRPERIINVAGDGQQALDFLRSSASVTGGLPDLILLDLNMPRLDGRQFLQAVKSSESLRAIPVVVFTTSSSPVDVNQSYARYANAYVTKPVDLDGFTDAVHRIDEFYTEIATTPGGRALPL